MSRRSLDNLIQFVHRLARREDGALTDAELLARFAERRDEAAFEALVWRHGQLIWNVCRRTLPNQQDAEDAFQATFLVLARKANTVRKRNAVGGWLYQVARRIALGIHEKNQGLAAQTLPECVAAEQKDNAERSDLRRFLEEELGRLPLKYQLPAVLHYLEGRSIAETAAIVGCPRGTILSRLAWTRMRLRSRLTSRGIGLGAVLSVMSASETSAAPMQIVLAAASGALAFVSKQALKSSRPVSLAKGVLRAMLITKVVVGSIGALSILTASVGLAMVRMPGGKSVPETHVVQNAGVDQPPPAKNQTKAVDQSKPESPPLPQANYVLPLPREHFLFTGRTEASQTVQIHPQITGMLDKVVVRPGSRVKKGDLLFVLGSSVWRAEFDKCTANVRRFEAQFAQGALTEVNLLAARASQEQARIQLEKAKIVAPIDGRVGRIQIDMGNVVNSSSTLATIVSISPISVSFNIDEDSFRLLEKRLQSPDGGKDLKFEMGLGTDKDFPHEGKLESIDNHFDPTSGTILARASFPNVKEEILPGMFARIRLNRNGLANELLIPQSAVHGNQDGNIVYVISAENKVATKEVVLGGTFDKYRIVRSGLKADDRVVVSVTMPPPGTSKVVPVGFEGTLMSPHDAQPKPKP